MGFFGRVSWVSNSHKIMHLVIDTVPFGTFGLTPLGRGIKTEAERTGRPRYGDARIRSLPGVLGACS